MAADNQQVLVDPGDCSLHTDDLRPASEAMSVLPGAWDGGPAHTDACLIDDDERNGAPAATT